MRPGRNTNRAGPVTNRYEEIVVAIARITEISSTSQNSFDDAIELGVARATRTLRNVKSAWVKEQRVEVRDDAIAEYQVNLLITFVLDDSERDDGNG